MLLAAAGAQGRVREEALADVLRSGHGAPLDLLVTVLGLLGLPGRELLVRGDCRRGRATSSRRCAASWPSTG